MSADTPWFILLTEPQQDLPTVWRLHAIGRELFVPIIRRRVKTGRQGRNGTITTRMIARPMFPGYGFLRSTSSDCDKVRAIRGVRDFLRNERAEPVTLPHTAVRAIHDQQQAELARFLATQQRGRKARFAPGTQVRLDPAAGAYAGLLATVDRTDSHGRIEILLGMIRHTLDQDLVVAA